VKWTPKPRQVNFVTISTSNQAFLTLCVLVGHVQGLFPHEEDQVVSFSLEMGDRGFGLTKRAMRKYVPTVAGDRAHKFGKNGPSDKWFRQFLGRHPEISFRTPEKLSTLRKANSTKEVIGPYFDKLKELVEKHKYPPENIWNADETSVCPRMKEEKILAPKGNFTIFLASHSHLVSNESIPPSQELEL